MNFRYFGIDKHGVRISWYREIKNPDNKYYGWKIRDHFFKRWPWVVFRVWRSRRGT